MITKVPSSVLLVDRAPESRHDGEKLAEINSQSNIKI